MKTIKMRQEVERKITTAAVDTLLAAGFSLNTNNGGDGMELPAPTADRAAILGALFTADDDRIHVYAKADDGSGTPAWFGWAYFVYGNDGWDVVNDYTINLERYVGAGTETQRLSDHYSEGA